MKHSLLVLATFLFAQTFSGIFAQTTITIGTGTAVNSTTTYPAPYGNWYFGAKHQMIITAAELNAAGMSSGNILSLAFDVSSANGVALEGFEIQLGTTTKTEWSFGDDFETGLTTVSGPTNYTETAGQNPHVFITPYYWDGISNLVVQTCFNNTAFSNNAVTFYTTTADRTVMYERDDAAGVCANVSGNFNRSFNRPNMIFQWDIPNIPPVAEFTASSTSSCSGQISFFDQSTNSPTNWVWDFGDGSLTSSLQNPSHTYLATGVYDVTLTATNAFGNDTEIKTGYITVNLAGANPVVNACTPITLDGSQGFGITNVTFNTLNVNSANASEGYADFTCDQTTVFAGQSYNFSATHNTPTTQNLAAWIDWNNDGSFNNTSELIISNTSSLTTSGSVTIPSNAVLNTPLRMRVMADYDLSTFPLPCVNPDYGQAEDYTIIVEQEMIPPVTNFSATPTITCDGIVSFTDMSENIPYAWAWDFGDGTTSVQVNPTHTYTMDGTYTVQLITTNAYGNNTLIQTNYIQVNTANNLPVASCEPSTNGFCCGYGIYKVAFNSINYSTGSAADGYQDYSCEQFTTVNAGGSYQIDVRTGADNPQDTKVWIDWNNDGSFDPTAELVFSALNAYDPTGTIVIPFSSVQSTFLRMRVSSDELGSTLNSCDDHLRGQTEDYGIQVDFVDGIAKNINSFVVYPNPATDNITINGINNFSDLNILDLTGKVIFQMNSINTNSVQLNLNNSISAGSYLIYITNVDGSSSVEKLIIK
jgi:PKD repeat protein